MVRKHLWLWVTLFIVSLVILVVLATGWNLVIVRDYQRFVQLARTISHPGTEPETVPWLSLIWGTVGFIVAVAMLVLFFVRLLQEMRLNQQQSEFLASVTHAFKTPIATLELSASILKEGEVSEEEKTKLWHSHEVELKRLKDEVDTLLEAARWQGDASAVKRTFVRLEDWLSESLIRWDRILGETGRLRREGDRLDFPAWIDPLLLNMATDNLLENARKFAQDFPKVTVRTAVLGKYWQIEVCDQGWGFEPADAKKIFRRFFRARNLAPRAIPGTGLGLYLARSACKKMGIRMEAKSEGRGMGAQFSMTGRIRRDAPAHGAQTMAKLFTSALLVEDEPHLATAILVALRKLEIAAHHASNLEEAQNYLATQTPPLILLDRALPDGEGVDFCARLRSRGYTGAVLMLTAKGTTEERVEGLDAGADDYLPKPFAWPEFEARVRALARRAGMAKLAPEPEARGELWQQDPTRLRIEGPNGWIELTPLEFKLAVHLIDAQGSIVGRDDLLKHVWGFSLLPKTRTVDHFMGRLRKHFELNPDVPVHFLTVRGAGYRFER